MRGSNKLGFIQNFRQSAFIFEAFLILFDTNFSVAFKGTLVSSLSLLSGMAAKCPDSSFSEAKWSPIQRQPATNPPKTLCTDFYSSKPKVFNVHLMWLIFHCGLTHDTLLCFRSSPNFPVTIRKRKYPFVIFDYLHIKQK